MSDVSNGRESRFLLYRLLGEPQRLRVLALASIEELSVGELAVLLDEPQPNVSRHITPLRQAGLLTDRHQGTRVFVRLADNVRLDPVIADALSEGERLCEQGGSLQRIAQIVAARDKQSRTYFANEEVEELELRPSMQVPVYAKALSMVSVEHRVALDAGTGSGSLLDVLAPTFDRVYAVDRSAARLELAKERAARRDYSNVTFVCGDVEGDAIRSMIDNRVGLAFASRMLHHASSPRATLLALLRLLVPGGQLCVVDYCEHDDELLREQRADVWMGFSKDQLASLTADTGFTNFKYQVVPKGFVQVGFDAHIPWFIATARRPHES
jgi:DNA-binding transcriptional ArsR family regulator